MDQSELMTAGDYYRYLLEKFSFLSQSNDQLTRIDAQGKVGMAQSSAAKLQRDLHYLQACYRADSVLG